MTQFDWERARAKNVKVKTPYVRRAPKRSSVDYDWENPTANNSVPYVWEQAHLEHTCSEHGNRLQELGQPPDDGYNLLRIYFNVFGRLNRGAYVKRWVPLLLILTISFRLSGLASGMASYMVIGGLLVLYAASKALQIRRLQDLGLSPVWLSATIIVDAGLVFGSGGLRFVCLGLALLYNFIFIYLYGSFGPNKYGPDPILRDLGDSDPFTSKSSFSCGGSPLILDIIFSIARIFLRG